MNIVKYVLLFVVLSLVYSCDKEIRGCTDELADNYNIEASIDDGSCVVKSPLLKIKKFEKIAGTVVRVQIEIEYDGVSPIAEKGVLWARDVGAYPNSERSKSISKETVFEMNIHDLAEDENYFAAAYIINAQGDRFYSDSIFFVTSVDLPTVVTNSVDEVENSSALLSGYLYSPSVFKIEEKGFCWGSSPTPTIADNSIVNEVNNRTFSSEIIGLNGGTKYYARAYAKNEAGVAYGQTVSFTTLGDPLSVGDFAGGGIVFYVDESGHGLILAMNDLGSIVPWGCEGTELEGADGSAIGTGQQNTTDIINSCAVSGIAALRCDELLAGGYSDWFLPSVDEMQQIYNQINIIDDALIANGSEAISDNFYWTSTESSNINAVCCSFYLAAGFVTSNSPKDIVLRVRPVRAF